MSRIVRAGDFEIEVETLPNSSHICTVCYYGKDNLKYGRENPETWPCHHIRNPENIENPKDTFSNYCFHELERTDVPVRGTLYKIPNDSGQQEKAINEYCINYCILECTENCPLYSFKNNGYKE